MPRFANLPSRTRRAASLAAAALVLVGGSGTLGAQAPVTEAIPAVLPAARPVVAGPPSLALADSMRGRSGRLMARIVRPADAARLRTEPLAALFGEEAFVRPAFWVARDSATETPFHFITLIPFEEKENGKLGVYRVGRWPAERRDARSEAYEVPEGFIEVNQETQDVRVSTHFRLRDFLTKDQKDVWPKALVLDPRLIDKLELVVSELRLAGYKAEGLTVLSGFRTPQYNSRGVGRRGGRAKDSRHQYGDAADVFVDNDRNGRMDDLNRDGRSDSRDARIFARIVDRVEQKYPELVGGVGVYRATKAHGPFVHIDARGERARWGL